MSNTNSPCQHPRESKVKRGVKEVFLLCEIWVFNFLDLWKYQIKTLWSVNFSISFHTWTLKLLQRFFEMRCFYFLICVKRTQDPPPPLSEIVQLSFRYISFHEVSHWNKPFFAIILRTTKIYPLRLKIVGSRIEMI